MNYRELLRSFRKRPGMYVINGSELRFDQAVAFVMGLDMGSQHALLNGFREFLVLKLDDGNSLVWWGLVVKLKVPEARHPLTAEQDQAAVEGLFDLLDEFLAEVRGPRGAASIHREHFLWLQQRPWHNLELERFHSSPPPPLLTLAETASALGVGENAVFDLMAEAALTPWRSGAGLLFRKHQVDQLAQQPGGTQGLPDGPGAQP